MTLKELIDKGNTFRVKRTKPQMYFKNGLNIMEEPVSYIENGDEYLLWVENCKRFLITNYQDDIAYDNFLNATNELPRSSGDIYKQVAILRSLESIPEKCVPSQKQPDVSEKVIVNVNQSQSINIDIVINALKEEIGKTGINKLKEVKNGASDDIKQGILSKLKGFGENALSNILANILTNPSVWSQL